MNLADFIKTRSPILLDGGMGTQLDARGLEMGGHNCLSHPDEVQAVHREYISSGSDILITNTLTMNRISLNAHDTGINVKDVNISGAKLARTAVGAGQYVVGDMSTTGQLLEPFGEYTDEQFYQTFREQAEYLLAGGVDGFIIETVFDLNEALCALRACRDVSDLPVLVTLSFQTVKNGGRTMMGNTAQESAQALADAGATAVGINCGDLDPSETAVVIGLMREVVDIPLIAQPNAGKPRLEGRNTVFDMSPEQFAQGILACIEAGANIVGGCCGTSPAHIQGIADVIKRGK